jgi:DNA-binding HxlR family transcriptional regulator
LADRLLELEHEGLDSKKIYPEIPPKVEYRLRPRAKELRVIFKELGTWACRWKVPRITTKTKSRASARTAG